MGKLDGEVIMFSLYAFGRAVLSFTQQKTAAKLNWYCKA